MKKIQIDARLIDASGIGTVIKNVVPAMIDKYSITFIGDVEKIKKHFELSEHVRVIHTKSKIYSISILFKYLFFPKADLLWVPHFNVPIFSNAKKRVVTIHDVYHLDFFDALSFLEKIFAKIFYWIAIKKSNFIITDSNFTLSRIRSYFKNLKSIKIKTIYLAADPSFGLKTNVSPKIENYFLAVGNVKPHKNLSILIRAYSKLPQTIKQKYALVIVGKRSGFINSANFKLEQDIIEKENIVFTGFVNDELLKAYYQNAHCLVMPSKYEGFGLPPLEAMSAKTPVILSNNPTLKEVCGEAGLYFSMNESDELTLLLKEMISNSELRRKQIKKGEERLKMYSWQKTQKQYLDLFNSLLQ